MIRMALKARAGQIYRFPLGCDPDILAANEVEAVTRFIKDGDPTAIVIPSTATQFAMRAISAPEADAAEAAAGRMPHYAMLVRRRISEGAAEAGSRAAGGDSDDAAKKRAADAATLHTTKALDALDDDDTAALAKLTAWNKRVMANKVAASIVSVEDPGAEPMAGAEFIGALTSSAHHMAPAFMGELTQRYRQISELQEGPKGLLSSASGCKKTAQRRAGNAKTKTGARGARAKRGKPAASVAVSS